MISRVWASTSTRFCSATALLMMLAATTVLPAPVGMTRIGRFLPVAIARSRSAMTSTLIGPQLRHAGLRALAKAAANVACTMSSPTASVRPDQTAAS